MNTFLYSRWKKLPLATFWSVPSLNQSRTWRMISVKLKKGAAAPRWKRVAREFPNSSGSPAILLNRCQFSNSQSQRMSIKKWRSSNSGCSNNKHVLIMSPKETQVNKMGFLFFKKENPMVRKQFHTVRISMSVSPGVAYIRFFGTFRIKLYTISQRSKNLATDTNFLPLSAGKSS